MKIFGYLYKVECDNSLEQMDAMGRLHARSLSMQIANDMSPQQIQSTILHEMIEGINYHLQLGLEHKTIMVLETGLFQVLTDNGIDLSPLNNFKGEDHDE